MGQTITELIITALLAFGFEKVSETLKSRQYYATLESGKIVQIEIVRLNRYACTQYCSIPHFHKVNICGNEHSKSETIFALTSNNNVKSNKLHFMNEPVIALFEASDNRKRKKSPPMMPINLGQNLPWKIKLYN